MGYINVAKPTGATYTNITKPSFLTNQVGIASGLLMPLTFVKTITINPYTNLSKPTGTNYTNINKPT